MIKTKLLQAGSTQHQHHTLQLPKLAYGQAILIWQQGRGGETATRSMHESYSSLFTYRLFTKDKIM